MTHSTTLLQTASLENRKPNKAEREAIKTNKELWDLRWTLRSLRWTTQNNPTLLQEHRQILETIAGEAQDFITELTTLLETVPSPTKH